MASRSRRVPSVGPKKSALPTVRVAVLLFVICFVFALVYQRFALRRDTEGALTRMVG